MGSNQIFREGQMRCEALELAPKSEPDAVLVGGETAAQGFSVRP
jgi:hypothetical protein